MTHRLSRPILVSLCLAAGPALHAPAARAVAPEEAAPAARPIGYLNAGLGLVEVAHLQGGVFLTPRLTVDAMVAWAGVFGSRFGGGLTYAIGPAASPGRPPRHALLIGARVMLDDKLKFASHGDDLTSYFVAPIGYGFLSDHGFSLRIGVAPVLSRDMLFTYDSAGAQTVRYRWSIGGPFFTASAGFWF
jgi:hypothetical protein